MVKTHTFDASANFFYVEGVRTKFSNLLTVSALTKTKD